MKKTAMYAFAVILLDAVAAYNVINSNIDPDIEAYKSAVSDAEQYESQELYYKSIQSYSKALSLKESYDMRIKIADLYGKGFENGEISSIQEKYKVLDTVIKKYPDESESYDSMLNYLESNGNYSKCADYVRLARKNNVTSDVITACYDKLRCMYTESETIYDSVRDSGNCMTAERKVIQEYNKTDESGNVIYTTDEEGNSVPETAERELTEYTFMYYDGTEKETYTAVNMSSPVSVTFDDGKAAEVFFRKDYGKDIASGELSDKIYSRIDSNGIRQCYIGENNEYEAVFPFNNSRITLFNTSSQKYDMFNLSGKKLAEDFDFLGCFADNMAYSENNGVKTVINTKGENVLPENVSDVILDGSGKCSYSGRMFVKYEGGSAYKMLDSGDFSETGFECEDADAFRSEAAAFCSGGKYGFVNTDGSVFIEPAYEDAKSFSNGFAAVKANGKWGFINKYGETVVEPAYDDALYMDCDGKSFVYLGGSWRMISLFYID